VYFNSIPKHEGLKRVQELSTLLSKRRGSKLVIVMFIKDLVQFQHAGKRLYFFGQDEGLGTWPHPVLRARLPKWAGPLPVVLEGNFLTSTTGRGTSWGDPLGRARFQQNLKANFLTSTTGSGISWGHPLGRARFQ